jgi:hypothetical protein
VPEARQLARVAVSDETWKAFRGAALAQGVSIAAYLGRLVGAEVARRDERRIAGVRIDDAPVDQALQALAEVRASIDELDAIAGRLARSATAHGASWADVASSLRLSQDAARAAYGSSR